MSTTREQSQLLLEAQHSRRQTHSGARVRCLAHRGPTLQMGADGVGVLKTRSCMSLEPHEGSWEARLPAHAILSYLRSVVVRSDDPVKRRQ